MLALLNLNISFDVCGVTQTIQQTSSAPYRVSDIQQILIRQDQKFLNENYYSAFLYDTVGNVLYEARYLHLRNLIEFFSNGKDCKKFYWHDTIKEAERENVCKKLKLQSCDKYKGVYKKICVLVDHLAANRTSVKNANTDSDINAAIDNYIAISEQYLKELIDNSAYALGRKEHDEILLAQSIIQYYKLNHM